MQFKRYQVLAMGLLLLCTAGISITASRPAAAQSFSDNFNGVLLDPAWVVVPGEGSYSLSADPGNLQYNLQGPLASYGGWLGAVAPGWTPSMAIMRQFNGDDWTLNMKVTYNLQESIGGGSTGAQGLDTFLQFGTGTQDYATLVGVTDYFYGNNYLNSGLVSGGVGIGNAYVQGAPPNPSGLVQETAWWQVMRNGDNVTVDESPDGTNYSSLFTGTLTDPVGMSNSIIIDGDVYSSAGSYADIDFVKVTVVSPAADTPEPSGLVVGATALVCCTLYRLMRARKRVTGST